MKELEIRKIVRKELSNILNEKSFDFCTYIKDIVNKIKVSGYLYKK